MRHPCLPLPSILSILSILFIPTLAADWPQPGNGRQHTACSSERLKLPFKSKGIDISWLERGDLFYLNKLAEAIRAYRAARF